MRTSEYERRRLALEKQYQEDLELIRDAHHARLRARSRCSGSVRPFQRERSLSRPLRQEATSLAKRRPKGLL